MVQAIFFDIDDTILDYDKCAVSTLQAVCKALNVPYSQETLTEYRSIDDALWAQQKLGKLSIPEVLEQRDKHMIAYWGLAPGTSFQDAFIRAFSDSADLVDGAATVLQTLHEKGMPIYGASNGFLAVQTNRLQKAGVLQYFRSLFVSDAVGYEKPDIRFFRHCLQETGYAAGDVLMIGDSIPADMVGAQNAGWNVCLFNGHGVDTDFSGQQIRSWNEFDHILNA